MLRKRSVVALWLLFLVAAFGVIAQTRFSADLSAFLPRLPTPVQTTTSGTRSWRDCARM
jgi:predicted exporter